MVFKFLEPAIECGDGYIQLSTECFHGSFALIVSSDGVQFEAQAVGAIRGNNVGK